MNIQEKPLNIKLRGFVSKTIDLEMRIYIVHLIKYMGNLIHHRIQLI